MPIGVQMVFLNVLSGRCTSQTFRRQIVKRGRRMRGFRVFFREILFLAVLPNHLHLSFKGFGSDLDL